MASRTALTPVRTVAVFDAGGITVAILGTPIDEIYPRSNYGLAQRILERGAIVSEYPAGTETKAYHFLERNRLVSGLADVVVIVEASGHSGTLRTASFAVEQGRDLYVVPGDITRPMSVGCNSLLRNAEPYVGFDDFMIHALKMRPGARKRRHLAPDERAIVDKIKNGVTLGEDIAHDLGIDIATFNQTITLLEMKSVVRSLGCNQWALA